MEDNIVTVNYEEKSGKLYLSDGEEKFVGDVYINHSTREIRVYNLSKSDLTSEEKAKIIFAILKETYMFPKSLVSTEIAKGNIATYTLLINGYLIDGSFYDYSQKNSTLIEDFVERSDYDLEKDSEFTELKSKIKYFYEKYEKDIGNRTVNIFFKNESILGGLKYYKNFSRLFASYLLAKKKKFRLIIDLKKIFKKEGEILIVP